MVFILVSLLKFATILSLLYRRQLALAEATDASLHSDSIHSEADANQASSNDLWSMVATMRDASKSTAHASGGQAPIEHAKFPWNINLDQHGRFQLNWKVNYAANKILFALEINTSKSNFTAGRDIFALGFSERGELASSDFCLIWFDLGHRIHLQDARTNSENLLELVDSSESVCKLIQSRIPSSRLHRAESTNNHDEDDDLADEFGGGGQQKSNSSSNETVETPTKSLRPSSRGDEILEILFKRPLEVCNKRDEYYTIDNGTTHVVWFTLMGPVLSLDQLNLTGLQRESSLAPDAPELRYVGGSGPNFEHGLRRAQLIAARPARAGSTGDRDLDLDIRMDKYQVQPVETTYWCKLFKLPEKFEWRRFHITSYEAVIEPGNEHVVHHMELFNCPTTGAEQRRRLDQLYQSQGGWSGECSSQDRPAATEPCRRVILAWAMGAKPLVYPEQVGQSIGGQDYSPYVVLEVHYNNVERSRGLVDSSGLRFHYSAELRPFDAGVLEVGLEYTDKNSIPPKMVVPLAGYCVSECTRAAMSDAGGGRSSSHLGGTGETTTTDRDNNHLDQANQDSVEANQDAEQEVARNNSDWPTNKARDGFEQPDSWHNEHRRRRRRRQRRRNQAHRSNGLTNGGIQSAEAIYIFAAQMHTHLTGVASWTEHVRGGRVLGELQRDDHYSPHFQEIRLLPEPVRVEPGDALVHYCLYDTRARVNITLGGQATTDEMCVTYLHYYPKIDLEVCKSSVDGDALEQYFAYLARDELQATSERLNDSKDKGPNGQRDKENGDKSGLRSVGSNYHSIDWTPRRARELIEFYSTAPLSVQCNRSDGSRWPGNWNGVEPTRLVKWPRHKIEPEAELEPDTKLDYFERPSSWELIAYRGLGHQRKHAQCSRS